MAVASAVGGREDQPREQARKSDEAMQAAGRMGISASGFNRLVIYH
jgi:hypothetical protein